MHQIAWSPDGNMIVFGSSTGIFVYSAHDYLLLRKFEVGHRINYLDVHPNGQVIAVGADGDHHENITLWDLQSGKPTVTLRGQLGDVVTDVAFSPDGSRLASGTNNGKVLLWDLTNASLLQIVLEPAQTGDRFIRHVFFSRDGSLMVVGDDNGTVRLFDAQTGHLWISIEGAFSSVINSIDISPDNEQIAIAGGLAAGEGQWSGQYGVIVFDTSSGESIHRVAEVAGDGSVDLVLFSPDGQSLITGSCLTYSRQTERCQHGLLERWNSQDGTRLQVVREYTGLPVTGDLSPDGKQLAVATWGVVPLVEFVDMQTDQVTKTIEWYSGPTSPVVFTADSKTAISGDPDGLVRFWDVDTGTVVKTLGKRGESVANLALNPTGHLLASSGWYRAITLWDLFTGRTQTIATRDGFQIDDLQFSPDGSWLVWIEIDRERTQVQVYDLARQLPVRSFTHPLTFHAATSPDGSTLAIGTFSENEENVLTFDIVSGEMLWKAKMPSRVIDLEFSPDGTRLAVGCEDGTISLWEASSGNYITTIPGAIIAFFQGKPVMASASLQGIRFWDMEGYKQILGYELADRSGIKAIAISPNGQIMATPLTNGTTLLWRVSDSNGV